jgi:membrane dipeptidase
MNNASLVSTERLEQARALHQRAIVIDTHCDTTQRLLDSTWDIGRRDARGHLDIPRMREGGVGGVFFAVYVRGPVQPGEGVRRAREQIARIKEVVSQEERDLVLARSAEDIRAAHAHDRIAIVIAIEGGYLIEDSFDVLREYHGAGAAYLTLTHSFHTSWADSSGVHEPLEPLHGGLTDFGREVIRELNQLGMMVDVSHVSDDTFRDVMDISRAPVVATHSSCRAVAPHRRNLADDMIRAIAQSGGVVQINFASAFIDPNYPEVDPQAIAAYRREGGALPAPFADHITPLSVLVDHFDHALQLVGPEHVGIGSDFDGVLAVPSGMEDCSRLPCLTAMLLERGYSEDDLLKVLGENVLRVMNKCHELALKEQGD